MTSRLIPAAVALAAFGAVAASAQTVDQLLADHALLNAELERCKQIGMASVDDAHCKIARVAENKRFFGTGTTYTPAPVNSFPNREKFDPQPNSQKAVPKPSGPPNG